MFFALTVDSKKAVANIQQPVCTSKYKSFDCDIDWFLFFSPHDFSFDTNQIGKKVLPANDKISRRFIYIVSDLDKNTCYRASFQTLDGWLQLQGICLYILPIVTLCVVGMMHLLCWQTLLFARLIRSGVHSPSLVAGSPVICPSTAIG